MLLEITSTNVIYNHNCLYIKMTQLKKHPKDLVVGYSLSVQRDLACNILLNSLEPTCENHTGARFVFTASPLTSVNPCTYANYWYTY